MSCYYCVHGGRTFYPDIWCSKYMDAWIKRYGVDLAPMYCAEFYSVITCINVVME